MSLFEVISGGGWLMVPLLICSLVSAAIIIERTIVLNKSKSNTRHLMMKLQSLLSKGLLDEAADLCSESKGSVAKVLKQGILRSHMKKDEILLAIENAGKEQVFTLEKNMGVLATIAGVAPLIGFLGTVTGMIKAFMEIERLSGNVNASVLAGGISEALLTTAAGLVVGIPTFIFYNYLQTKVQRNVHEMETSSSELIELLMEENKETNMYAG